MANPLPSGPAKQCDGATGEVKPTESKIKKTQKPGDVENVGVKKAGYEDKLVAFGKKVAGVLEGLTQGTAPDFVSPETRQNAGAAQAGTPESVGVAKPAENIGAHYVSGVQGVKDLGSDYLGAMKAGHRGAWAGTGAAAALGGLLLYRMMKRKKKAV
jgi:hypothetical protein